MAGVENIQTQNSQRLSNEIDEARAIVLTLHESAKACAPEQDGLQSRLMRAAGALDKWVHRYAQACNQIDKLNAQVAGIANAVKQLSAAHEDLGEVDAFMFVCMQALQTKSGDDVCPCVVTVLAAAYDKLVLDVNTNLRDALKALDQEGGQ